MNILVCGGRSYSDEATMRHHLSRYAPSVSVLIHGGAGGADMLAERVAYDLGWQSVRGFPANWREHGKRAGPIRNQQMLDEGKPDVQVDLARLAGFSQKHVCHMLTGRAVGSVDAWDRLADALGLEWQAAL